MNDATDGASMGAAAHCCCSNCQAGNCLHECTCNQSCTCQTCNCNHRPAAQPSGPPVIAD